MSDSLQLLGLQHAKIPCPSLSPGVCSNTVHQVSEAIQPSHPLLPPSTLDLSLAQHQSLFHIRWPMYRSFSISPSDEYSELEKGMTNRFSIFALRTS